ncbi:hypothetical protein Q1M64_33560 [Sinorhizobium meliloti]|nr:hypothetical protein Q1M64_33560 [Sinorhizobium meliloti]
MIAHVALVQTLAPRSGGTLHSACIWRKSPEITSAAFQGSAREAQLHDREDRLEVSRVLDP